MGLLERVRKRVLPQEEEYPREYEDITKIYIIIKKDGTNEVIPAHLHREYGPIENVDRVTFNRPYDFSFSEVTFARTVIAGYIRGNYQIFYAWKDPVKVTVTRGYFGDISVSVGEG